MTGTPPDETPADPSARRARIGAACRDAGRILHEVRAAFDRRDTWEEERFQVKLLGLLRHAKSDWDDLSTRDFDRRLNARGKRGAALMGDHIRDHGIKWDRLIASPAQRVKSTLESALPGMTPQFDQRLYLASSQTLMEIASEQSGEGGDDPHAVLIAGHNPGLQELVLDLVSPSRENDLFGEAIVKFPTATFALLECDVDDWSKVRNHCAALVHFARPRDLDPELGPQR